MLLTDFKKELRDGLADRGFRSMLAAANSIGVSSQHFTSTLLGSPVVRPAALKMLENLGYDVEVRLVRRLPEDEYMTEEQASVTAHELDLSEDPEAVSTIYRVRCGKKKYDDFYGTRTGQHRVSGKLILARCEKEDPSYESIPVTLESEYEAAAVNAYNRLREKKKLSGIAYKTGKTKVYKLTTTVIILEKCVTDLDTGTCETTILRKYAAPGRYPGGDNAK